MTPARKEQHAQLIAACRVAAPASLEPLWLTITHVPDNVFPDVASQLTKEHPCEDSRLRTILDWLGHGDGGCPICWMLVGRLVFTIPEPIERLSRTLSETPTPTLINGAALFLSSQLEPRHSRPAGIAREELTVLQSEVRVLPAPIKDTLLAHWQDAGRERSLLARRFE